jgi:AraC-like DNA-binding protein
MQPAIPPTRPARPPADFLDRLGAAGCRALLEAVPDVRFFVKDAGGAYVFASRPMYLAHGFVRASDLLGRTDRQFIPGYLAENYVADDRTVLRGGQVLGRIELVTRHRGCPDWYVTSKTALRGEDGAVVGVFGVSRELKEAAGLPGVCPEMARAVERIREQYADSIELDLLARLSGMSLRSFQRRFKSVFHVSPMEYLRQFRAGRACQMLVESNATVATIAAECGYCDHSHLTREFRRLFGTRPGHYRKRYRADPAS